MSLTFNQTKVDRELGRDLLQEVAGDVEGVEGDILHQEEHGIRQLGQLTLAQVCKEDIIIIVIIIIFIIIIIGSEVWSFASRCVLIPISDIFSVLVPVTRIRVYRCTQCTPVHH